MADCSLIQMRRRIQRLLKYNENILQIPSVESARHVIAEIVARRQFHSTFSSWHERQRRKAAEYCKIERDRRTEVNCANSVLTQFLLDDPVPHQSGDIRVFPLSSNLPKIDPAEVRNQIFVPQMTRDNETQCPTTSTNGMQFLVTTKLALGRARNRTGDKFW